MAPTSRFDFLEDTGGNLRFLQAILAAVALSPSSRILEIGCGTGALGMLLGAVTGAKIYGTELSAELTAIARTRMHCLHCPQGNIPEIFGVFDLVYCKDMLMMVADKRRFYSSIRCRLRPGGAFCTYFPDEADYFQKPLFSFVPSGLAASRLCYGSLQENLRTLKECGFERIHTERLFLGSVQLNEAYVRRHWDGYFSNSDSSDCENERQSGLRELLDAIKQLEDFGILAHYDWERTMLVVR